MPRLSRTRTTVRHDLEGIPAKSGEVDRSRELVIDRVQEAAEFIDEVPAFISGHEDANDSVVDLLARNKVVRANRHPGSPSHMKHAA